MGRLEEKMKGINNPLAYGVCKTSKGWLALLASRKGLVRLTLPLATRGDALAELSPPAGAVEDPPPFEIQCARLQRYFDGLPAEFEDELDLTAGTPFQQLVWRMARTIPAGRTESYGWIAREMGNPRACRAVGQALGRNPIPLIVPCHRVLAAGGRLGGFSGGLDIKISLLRLEGITPLPH
jgi:methylated-DNA-[protein]-cysteine S-methyltransferase